MSTLARARAFAEPLLAGQTLDSGENMLAHADGMAAILEDQGASESLRAVAYLVYAVDHLNRPQETIARAFDDGLAALSLETTKLLRVQRQAVSGARAGSAAEATKVHLENVRKMLLAFSRDLRVVMLRLASRLQTLRHHAASRTPVVPALAQESLHVLAPLANRLGLGALKWEMEDLAFRFIEPTTYHDVARRLDAKRSEREAQVQQLREQIHRALLSQRIAATVLGRPKHIYSIVRKMRGKGLDFSQVYDVRALRVIVSTVTDCYAVLAYVHERYTPVPEEFDDYIARPKSNGYQSLHTVVRDETGQAVEIQIRTQSMNEHAEHGVAAHWAYKEAGVKGYEGVSAAGDYEAKIAVLRQLLAWQRDMESAVEGGLDASASNAARELLQDQIYVLTPAAQVVELPRGATPLDFAYSVHTSLGHRCRGARIDGAMVPLNTALRNGQTVEIVAAKEGGPSRDWLNAELGFLVSHRARSKVRAWFNTLAQAETIARGREAVERLLQREGRTALAHDDLALRLGLANAEAMFEAVGKDELSLRQIETAWTPTPVVAAPEVPVRRPGGKAGARASGGVMVVGVGSLLTQMAKCCKPAPPDDISGFVTRGKGVSVHRADCSNYRQIAARSPERVIEVEWGVPARTGGMLYPVDVTVEASDRNGLLRDISEVFAKDKINVIGVQSQSVRDGLGTTAWMTFTVELSDVARLGRVLAQVQDVRGVRRAHRR